jgi:hypothetical protein
MSPKATNWSIAAPGAGAFFDATRQTRGLAIITSKASVQTPTAIEGMMARSGSDVAGHELARLAAD